MCIRDRNTGFPIPSDPSLDLVHVFEAPIDLMSYLTLHREPINAVALCGLYEMCIRDSIYAGVNASEGGDSPFVSEAGNITNLSHKRGTE